MVDLPHLRRVLLGLLGPEANRALLCDFSEPDWRALAELTHDYRLAPLLHAEWPGKSGLVPDWLRREWQVAHRSWGLTALAQRADLLASCEILKGAGIASVGLKGAFLAWHAYPAPAMRPMRDIDLLVPAARAMNAWQLLREAGYASPERDPDDRDLAAAKHLPPLIAPQGTMVEIHVRCWQSGKDAGCGMPGAIDEQMLAKARSCGFDDPVHYPDPEDLLAHLAVHATAPAPFDTVPQFLPDLDFLTRKHAFDWPRLWQRARAEKWERHAALALAATDRWRRPGLLGECGCPLNVPVEVLEPAPDLLFQQLVDRSATQFIAGLGKSPAGLLGKLRAHRPEGFVNWFANRARRTIGDLASREIRRRAGGSRVVAAWLEG